MRFAIFPEFVYYNQALFDEAKLAYRPKYGAKYTLDGKEVDWNFDTVMAEVAKRLTVDAQGNDATQAGLDAKNIVQYGYITQWSEHPRHRFAVRRLLSSGQQRQRLHS
ncbi:MAG: hypothetical protein IPO15_19950 [Anaerolineae bacterium]|uniref:hypothetical protein n=1 Tax=Candidatus Amarolinea dominans TaxID=3140696 RepID=UPI0031361710|nr:hypothetical protein [Anaerolineae bacterium]